MSKTAREDCQRSISNSKAALIIVDEISAEKSWDEVKEDQVYAKGWEKAITIIDVAMLDFKVNYLLVLLVYVLNCEIADPFSDANLVKDSVVLSTSTDVFKRVKTKPYLPQGKGNKVSNYSIWVPV